MERAELASRLGGSRPAGPRVRHPDPVLVSEADPARFMAAFAAAVAGDAEVCLCDPQWGEHEHEQLEELLPTAYTSSHPFPGTRGWLMIPTGGSSGQLKFARHDQDTLSAAVRGFLQHFALPRVNAAGVLPLHHVSGLMAWLRCALTGGEYLPLDWKRIEAGELPELSAKPDGWVLSLVPTQLERLLRHPAASAWLRQFRILFLGGAPAWPDLLARAAAERLPLAPGYGMTETAAMATALRPAEFLAGRRDSGTALPHTRVTVNDEGVVVFTGASLFRGYYPYWERDSFATADLGRLDEQGRLTILGRRDGLIISGGEKIQPAEVERVLRDTGEFDDVAVVGVPDVEWGEAVVAAYPATCAPDLAKVAAVLRDKLAAPKRPKRYVALVTWPVSAVGKIYRGEVIRLVGEAGGGAPPAR